MKQPLVSIVIPVYNGTNYMREAIDSALAQTYENKEVLVVNDGSNDDGATERLALSYGDKIRYFSKENGGSSSALNFGIEHMRGEWFSWLSHDDLYLPGKLESQMRRVSEKGLDDGKTVIRCGTVLVDAEGKPMLYNSVQNRRMYTPLELLDKLLLHSTINGCAMLIPKTLLDQTGGFDTSLRYLNDWEMWIRFALHGVSMDSYDEVLVKNRVHGGQVSVKQKSLYLQERPRIMSQTVDYIHQHGLGSDFMRVALYASAGYGDKEALNKARKALREQKAYHMATHLQCGRYRVQKAIGRSMRSVYHGVQHLLWKK